jgi:hypothetical protein
MNKVGAWQWVPIDDECKTIGQRGCHRQDVLLLLPTNPLQQPI